MEVLHHLIQMLLLHLLAFKKLNILGFDDSIEPNMSKKSYELSQYLSNLQYDFASSPTLSNTVEDFLATLTLSSVWWQSEVGNCRGAGGWNEEEEEVGAMVDSGLHQCCSTHRGGGRTGPDRTQGRCPEHRQERVCCGFWNWALKEKLLFLDMVGLCHFVKYMKTFSWVNVDVCLSL